MVLGVNDRRPVIRGTAPFERDTWRLSADERQLAVGEDPEDCVRYPGQNTCHTQVWPLRLVNAQSSRTVAYGQQPVGPLWVGNDGTVLVASAITTQAFPKEAPAGQLPPLSQGLSLVRGDGSLLELQLQAVRQVVEVGDVLLLHTSDGDRELLTALDPTTGAMVRVFEQEDAELRIQLDERRQRLAVTVSRHTDGDTLVDLWAGAVPRP